MKSCHVESVFNVFYLIFFKSYSLQKDLRWNLMQALHQILGKLGVLVVVIDVRDSKFYRVLSEKENAALCCVVFAIQSSLISSRISKLTIPIYVFLKC